MFSVSKALLRLRHGQLGMLCGARAGCGRLLTDGAGAEAAEIQELKTQMVWALEAVHAIDESANQAYLERDPCARPAPVTFQEHYQRQALDYVERAVATYNTLRTKHGEDRIAELEKSEGFGPLLVDTFLARQQLRRRLNEG